MIVFGLRFTACDLGTDDFDKEQAKTEFSQFLHTIMRAILDKTRNRHCVVIINRAVNAEIKAN